ncbi:TetR family transcriptional regulator [Streptacidiphilus monticola]|uniref:TetR family transcriptional regulator n=1 Tax=Streptacidiphilus monticola TaxID=2161674 RepID=A0ABW1GBX1_9ACTN
MTAFRELVRSLVRDRMLDAAYASVASEGWGRLRLAEVARQAGFSRQTVYNEFGSKEALGLALAERELGRFLDGIQERMEAHRELEDAATAGIEYTLRLAAENALVKSVLTSGRGGDEELLAYLTTRAEPVFDTASAMLDAYAQVTWPEVDAESRSLAVEAVVRLTVSHIVQPAGEPLPSARRIARMIARIAYAEAASDAG